MLGIVSMINYCWTDYDKRNACYANDFGVFVCVGREMWGRGIEGERCVEIQETWAWNRNSPSNPFASPFVRLLVCVLSGYGEILFLPSIYFYTQPNAIYFESTQRLFLNTPASIRVFVFTRVFSSYFSSPLSPLLSATQGANRLNVPLRHAHGLQ